MNLIVSETRIDICRPRDGSPSLCDSVLRSVGNSIGRAELLACPLPRLVRPVRPIIIIVVL